MKVLAFNGSPRNENATTECLVGHFLDGAREAGAETEIIRVAQKKINYCKGCFNCWFVTPGRCIHNDDMPEIREKIKRSDILVYGTPLYVDGVTAQLKTMMDRQISSAMPFVKVENGRSRHPGRGKGTGGRKKMVFISNCGFGEKENFGPVIQHMKAVARNMGVDYLGSLVRPMGGILSKIEESDPETIQAIYQAFQKAGYEAVDKGALSEDVQNEASKAIMSMEEYGKFINSMMHEMMSDPEK